VGQERFVVSGQGNGSKPRLHFCGRSIVCHCSQALVQFARVYRADELMSKWTNTKTMAKALVRFP
jgi:hypothetical protein